MTPLQEKIWQYILLRHLKHYLWASTEEIVWRMYPDSGSFRSKRHKHYNKVLRALRDMYKHGLIKTHDLGKWAIK